MIRKKIFLFDSLSQSKKEVFSFSDKKKVSLYVCGITPYDHAHIGHARCYVVFDLFVRLIRYHGGCVTYIQNITDVNEKIFDRALQEYGSRRFFYKIADRYHGEFVSLLETLGCVRPDLTPKVSSLMSAIITFIEDLLREGFAYETMHGVYYDVKKFTSYGSLSKRLEEENNESIESRVDTEGKKNREDFVLWKKNSSEAAFCSPWGEGFPGWHIECSAMIRESFGAKTVDIHGGGIDLLFPHHENERAQSQCLLKEPFVSLWAHVAYIKIKNQKMSKSLNNSIYLKDVYTSFSPMVLRFYLLIHHYSSPIEFAWEELKAAEKSYKKLVALLSSHEEYSDQSETENDFLLKEIESLLLDNLNTAAAIGLLFKHKKIIMNDSCIKRKIALFLRDILGLDLRPIPDEAVAPLSSEIKKLIEEREQAREKKDFKRADEIRDFLVAQGIVFTDKKNKT
jgi:cysteinyl-tRNA synthetase